MDFPDYVDAFYSHAAHAVENSSNVLHWTSHGATAATGAKDLEGSPS